MSTHFIAVRDCDLAATLTSGQAFRWTKVAQAPRSAAVSAASSDGVSPPAAARGGTRPRLAGEDACATTVGLSISPSDSDAVGGVTPAQCWEGVIAGHWVRLSQKREGIEAETAMPTSDWSWLEHYLNTRENLDEVLHQFPDDAALRDALVACQGLRLLQQDPWECLASFILSSTKQIIQIQQIVDRLCSRYGEPIAVPPGHPPAHRFPTPARLAQTTETELRECRMGFRARHLHSAARTIAEGHLDLDGLRKVPLAVARDRLMQLSGVGRKIADCVLLFSLGHRRAFPVDTWIARALRSLYFNGRRVTDGDLITFTESHFGPEAGYAQQYLFQYARQNPHLVQTAD